ncbi:NAD-binding protein [Sulfurimonas sp. HSL-1716]|uniref:NAD-binding protein n=1 Tax=Hydrocurvibacter sulfurireducens TaxID=3131937 RepID=UPI0031F7DC25
MNIVIAGAGKVGFFLAKELMEDNEVTLIDSNEGTIKNLEDSLDVLTIYGDVEDPNLYKSIQKDVDLFVAVTNSDEVNLLSSLIIDNIVDVKEKIVRLRNNFFINDNIKRKLSISTMITPAIDVAHNFKLLVNFPHISNIKTFEQTEALLLSIKAYEGFGNISIFDFIHKYNNKIVVAGIERAGNFFVPDETEILKPNDLIYFFVFSEVVDSIREKVCNKVEKQSLKNCIIYGANQLGIEISKVLAKKGLNVKLVDKSLENCQNANTILKNSIEVIKSNYNNLDAVLDNFTGEIDVFIASTNDDEFNIIKCIEAKQKEIKKVIGIYNNNQYATLMRKLGIEVIRGEKMNAYFTILEHINSTKLVSQKAYCNGAGTACLRKILPNSKLIGTKPFINDKLNKKGSFYILRDEKFILYQNIGKLQEDDIIIAFMRKKDSKLITAWLKQNDSE